MKTVVWTFAVLGVCWCATSSAWAIDTVKKTDKQAVIGNISDVGREKVTVTRRTERIDVPVREIASIVYEGEPPELNLARSAIDAGRYEDALAALNKIDTAAIDRALIVQEIDFQKSLVSARLAMRGEGSIRDAGRRMARFAANYPNSYHWFQASELVGDLLVAHGQYAAALRYYEPLENSPWLDYRMRAAVAIGQAELAAGKPDEALQSFQKALDLKAATPKEINAEVIAQSRLAQLGKARCLAAAGKTDEAVQQIRDVIAQIEAEDLILNAKAYNALGTVLRKADKPQDALLAFLHVDVIYFADPDQHAEALANLSELWNELHKPERAIRAQEILQKRYKNSRWTSP